MIFRGSGVALVTPFNEDLSVNYEKLKELINYHIENKTDAIIILGTTGESATLTDEEKHNIIDFSVKITKGKIPLIVGTGSNNTKHAVELSKYAASKGVDGLLVVTPYYNKCSQEGLYLHYKEIAEAVNETPIILYNVPSRTKVDIEVETIKRLSKFKNIVGIKEATDDLSKIIKIKCLHLENFAIYSGNDDLTLPILSFGGDGVISVLANIRPKVVHEICNMYFSGKNDEAKALFLENFNLTKALFCDVNPIPIKFAMNELGMNVGSLRLPLCETTSENKKIIRTALNN